VKALQFFHKVQCIALGDNEGAKDSMRDGGATKIILEQAHKDRANKVKK
jgi:hypothetical protein